MFGHLKADELMNLIEGEALPGRQKAHLDGCAPCQKRLEAVQPLHARLAVPQVDPIEPDWDEFRHNVRLALLSRAVQRESVVRRWTGWAIRPAMAYGLSLMLLVAVGTGGYLWHTSQDQERISAQSKPGVTIGTITLEPSEFEAETAAWAKKGLFEELSTLQEPQVQRLKQLMESAPTVVDQE